MQATAMAALMSWAAIDEGRSGEPSSTGRYELPCLQGHEVSPGSE
jgi:hypothetical protein